MEDIIRTPRPENPNECGTCLGSGRCNGQPCYACDGKGVL